MTGAARPLGRNSALRQLGVALHFGLALVSKNVIHSGCNALSF